LDFALNRGLPGVCDRIREANKEIAELGLIATASVTLSRLLDLRHPACRGAAKVVATRSSWG
jgi:hypothetical protein